MMCILAAEHKPDKDYLSDRLSEAHSSPSDEAKPSPDRGVSDGLSRGPDRGVGGLHKEGEELWNL